VENFAKAGQTTVGYVIEAVEAMDADVVALQEIAVASRFEEVAAGLEGWIGFRGTEDRYQNLAFLYRDDPRLVMESIYYILSNDDAFARAPLVFQGSFDGVPFRIVNNHFKCCGDGTIDPDDYWDEEYRRQRASVALEDFIRTRWPGENVFLVGDLNDQLTDAEPRNVFQVFLDAPDRYRFVDMAIAEGPGSGWSFPGYPSHLDHVLVTASLFAAVDGPESLVQVVPLHTYLPRGFQDYDAAISDHLPVALRVDLD
jgi:predicted extracellular nuclease